MINKTSLLACAAVLGMAGAASATTVTLSETLTSQGQDMQFLFTGLGASNGTGATLTLATTGTGRRGTLGFDLSGAFPGEDEYFTVSFEGASQGSYSCGGSSSNGSTAISGATDNSFNYNDCVFSLELAIAAADFDSLIADGTFDLGVDFGAHVSTFGHRDVLSATLSYADIADIAPVPLPASGLLLLAGLGGVAALKRRKKHAA